MDNGLKLIEEVLPGMLEYLPWTIYFLILPSLASMVLGTWICIIRVGKKNIIYYIVSVFVSFFRGTPGIVQIYLVLYGLPKLLEVFGIYINDWSSATFFMIATIFNFSSFVSESLRGAYQAMDYGQIEAGLSIGYGKLQCFFKIIIPQTLQIALLNLKNLEVDLLKGTALAYIIGATELMGYANRMIALHAGVGRMWILGCAAVIYFLLCALLELFFNGLARYFSKHERGIV